MVIEERVIGDITVLDLKGKMTLGEGDELLKDKINSLIHQGQKKLLLNLEGVPYIDSAGLGEIVRTYTTVSRQGGNLKLVNLTKRITDLLSITKLLTVFETFDNEPEALKSFQAAKVEFPPAPALPWRARHCPNSRCPIRPLAGVRPTARWRRASSSRCGPASGPRTSSSSQRCCSASGSPIRSPSAVPRQPS